MDLRVFAMLYTAMTAASAPIAKVIGALPANSEVATSATTPLTMASGGETTATVDRTKKPVVIASVRNAASLSWRPAEAMLQRAPERARCEHVAAHQPTDGVRRHLHPPPAQKNGPGDEIERDRERERNEHRSKRSLRCGGMFLRKQATTHDEMAGEEQPRSEGPAFDAPLGQRQVRTGLLIGRSNSKASRMDARGGARRSRSGDLPNTVRRMNPTCKSGIQRPTSSLTFGS